MGFKPKSKNRTQRRGLWKDESGGAALGFHCFSGLTSTLYRWGGAYGVAANAAHPGVDGGRIGTKIAGGAGEAVLQPPTSFQTAKCGPEERQVQLSTLPTQSVITLTTMDISLFFNESLYPPFGESQGAYGGQAEGLEVPR